MATADPFARSTAAKAHKRATKAANDAAATKALMVELVGERPIGHAGRCCLCGEQAVGRYCHAHRWAA